MTRLPSKHPEEIDREYRCRQLGCPSCGAMSGTRCAYPIVNDPTHLPVNFYSHTARYDLAASAGLVPPLPKGNTDEPDPPRLSARHASRASQ